MIKIKSPTEYKNLCPGYLLSLTISLFSLASILTQAYAAPTKYTVSEETLNLPHQFDRDCIQNNNCPELGFRITEKTNITVEEFKKYGKVRLNFPYISNQNTSPDGVADRTRTITTKLNEEIFSERCNKKSPVNTCRFKFLQDLTKLKYYLENLGIPSSIKCFYDAEERERECKLIKFN